MGEGEGLPEALGVRAALGVGAATENVAQPLGVGLWDAEEVGHSVGVGVGEVETREEAVREALPVALAAGDSEGEGDPLLEEVGDALATPVAVAEPQAEGRGEGVGPPPPGAAATLGVAEPETLSSTWVRVAQPDAVLLVDGEALGERAGEALAEPAIVAELHTLPDGVDVPPMLLGVAAPVEVLHACVLVAHPDAVRLVDGEALFERVGGAEVVPASVAVPQALPVGEDEPAAGLPVTGPEAVGEGEPPMGLPVEPPDALHRVGVGGAEAEPLGVAPLLGELVEEATEAVPNHEAVAVPQPECWGLAVPLAVVLPLAVALSDSEKVGPTLAEPEPEGLGAPEALGKPVALPCALPVPAMDRESVPQPVGDTLSEAEGDPPTSEGEAVTLSVGDPRPLGDVEALAQRVGLRVSVPLTLPLRERVTEVVSDPEGDSEGLTAGLPLGLGEGDSLPLAEALCEPLPLLDVLP